MSRKISKGWGYEVIWADTPDYCGKFLHFNKGGKFSMHFHAKKDETWYVLSGKFLLRIVDTKTATINVCELIPGSVWRNEPLVPHQLVCLEEGDIIEVSTADSVEDNYRVGKGNSQT